jgi:hypothetical protein
VPHRPAVEASLGGGGGRRSYGHRLSSQLLSTLGCPVRLDGAPTLESCPDPSAGSHGGYRHGCWPPSSRPAPSPPVRGPGGTCSSTPPGVDVGAAGPADPPRQRPEGEGQGEAPIVTRTKATRLIGPYGASAEGRANTPVPITEPITKAVAVGGPKRAASAERRQALWVCPLPEDPGVRNLSWGAPPSHRSDERRGSTRSGQVQARSASFVRNDRERT